MMDMNRNYTKTIASVGWKGMRAAERLVEQYMIRIESVSSYSASASAN